MITARFRRELELLHHPAERRMLTVLDLESSAVTGRRGTHYRDASTPGPPGPFTVLGSVAREALSAQRTMRGGGGGGFG